MKQNTKLKERHNIESITADTLERLIKDLNDNHFKKNEGQMQQIKQLKNDIAIKNKKSKDIEA